MNDKTTESMTDEEMLEKLKSLSTPALVIVHTFTRLLLAWEWMQKIPQRWVIFMMKREAQRETKLAAKRAGKS